MASAVASLLFDVFLISSSSSEKLCSVKLLALGCRPSKSSLRNGKGLAFPSAIPIL